MDRSSSYIADIEFLRIMNVEDINKMLSILRLPDHIDPLFVVVVVRGDDWYPNDFYEEEGTWYLSINLQPDDARKMGSEAFTVAVKNELLKYLESLELVA